MAVTDTMRTTRSIAKGGNLVPGAASFNPEIELQGNREWLPAKVVPPTRREFDDANTLAGSIHSICPLGIQIKNTLHWSLTSTSTVASMQTRPCPTS